MIRITAGRWRGRSIRTAPGARTRPSSARLREGLFSMLGNRIEGVQVVDLFAGAGSLGLEALSRGARHVTFVEIDPVALKSLGQNLETLGVDPAWVRVRRGDARRWLEKVAQDGRSPTDDPMVVVADPPYTGPVGELLPLLGGLVESGALVAAALEHPAEMRLETILDTNSTIRFRTRTYGRGSITLIEAGTP